MSGLLEVITRAKKRVLVTTFASNAARLQTLAQVAKEIGRTLCVAGRSLDRLITNAKAAGYLRDFPHLVDFDEAMRMPRSTVLIIPTCGQGEPHIGKASCLGRVCQYV